MPTIPADSAGRLTARTVAAVERLDLMRRFGARVRELRRARGMRRVELATAVGVSKIVIERIEQGRGFTAGRIAPLAVALGVEPRDLFDWTPPPSVMSPALERLIAIVEAETKNDPDFAAKSARLIAALRAK